MNISIIISTWNNAALLDRTLKHFLNKVEVSDELVWELILVNNNSTDNTEDIINSYKGKLPIVYLFEPKQGLSYARNAGINVARGELIIFTDDDVKPYPQWTLSYWKAYQEKPRGYYFGGSIESDFEEGVSGELLKLAPVSVKGVDMGSEPHELTQKEHFFGANWACPKYLVNQVGGFDISLGLDGTSGKPRIGEERNYMNRLDELGIKGWYLPGAKLQHFVPKSKTKFKHIMDRREAYGRQVAYESSDKNCEKLFFGMSSRVIQENLREFVRFLIVRIKGQEGYKHIAKIKFNNGYIQGLNELQNLNRRDSK